MDLEYEYKLGEMKKYIPFLESMIARLEDTNSTSTKPRQAQLEKMKTLRDLLLDTKKRMKMENLLKCEQVLSNLYAKVEQSDTLPGIIKASDKCQSTSSEISEKSNELDAVRNKLKHAMTKTHEEIKKTLPDIDVANEICGPPSSNKEPALFQRRPDTEPAKDKNSLSTEDFYGNLFKIGKPEKSSLNSDPILFTRRTSKKGKRKKFNNMNFKLKIPEEKIESLNTDDILNRIIECRDSDVEIATLRQLKMQILDELDTTDPDSDLSKLLKSCKGKHVNNSKADIEEGELPDSDTEIRENVSGKIVIVKNDKKKDEQQVEICLVVKTKDDEPKVEVSAEDTDFSDFEINDDLENYHIDKKCPRAIDIQPKTEQSENSGVEISNPCSLNKASNNQEFKPTSLQETNTLKTSNPLLNAEKIISQADILNALKSEILNENIDIPGLGKIPIKPPKEVSQNLNVPTKRRISLEKYKQISSRTSSPIMPSRSNSVHYEGKNHIYGNEQQKDRLLDSYRNPEPPQNIPVISSRMSNNESNSLVKSVTEVQKMLPNLCPNLINSLMPVCDMVSKSFGSPRQEKPSYNQYRSLEQLPKNTHLGNAPAPPTQYQQSVGSGSYFQNNQKISCGTYSKNHSGNIQHTLPKSPIFLNTSISNEKNNGTEPSLNYNAESSQKKFQNTVTKKYAQAVEIFTPKAGGSKQNWRPKDPRLNRNTEVKKGTAYKNVSLLNSLVVDKKEIINSKFSSQKACSTMALDKTIMKTEESPTIQSVKETFTKQEYIAKKHNLSVKKKVIQNDHKPRESFQRKKPDHFKKRVDVTPNIKPYVDKYSTLSSTSAPVKKFKIPKIKLEPENFVDDFKTEDFLKDETKEKEPNKKRNKKKKRILIVCSDSDEDFENAFEFKKGTSTKHDITDEKPKENSNNGKTMPKTIGETTKVDLNKKENKINHKIQTQIDETAACLIEENKNKSSDVETLQIPDSTCIENVQEKIIDVVIDKQKGEVSIVNEKEESTTDKQDDLQPSSSKKEIDVDSILLLLQDKSKINELLKKIQDQPFENEKLKKKLEKFSKLSDDEDSEIDEPRQSPEKEEKCKNIGKKPVRKSVKKQIVPVNKGKKQEKKMNMSNRKIEKKLVTKKKRDKKEYEELLDLFNSTKATKSSRELKSLENDIKEIISHTDVSTTSRRKKQDIVLPCSKKPIVVIERLKLPEFKLNKDTKVKCKPKIKMQKDSSDEEETMQKSAKKHKKGQKSKKKINTERTNNLSDSCGTNDFVTFSQQSSDSDIDEVAQKANPVELKKKRKRRKGKWEKGIIKASKIKKQKPEVSETNEMCDAVSTDLKKNQINFSCFTDVNYCFYKDNNSYYCCLCTFVGSNITQHHKQMHKEYEVPISRLNPAAAEYAKSQCENLDLEKIHEIPIDGYVCRFCSKEFEPQTLTVTFFWHIVSVHTGEYSTDTTTTINRNDSFELDIPSPPSGQNNQLTGYLCGKCNYTQISIENVKNHVIVRHNDEETLVYNITMSALSDKIVSALSQQVELNKEKIEDQEIVSDFQLENKPKILFEENNDIILDSNKTEVTTINEVDKTENIQTEECYQEVTGSPDSVKTCILDESEDSHKSAQFKITFNEKGSRQFVCFMDENYNFKTSLLISMKRHVQDKHNKSWDGYCYECKTVVMPKGDFTFRHCLEHYIEKHNAPIIENQNINTATEEVKDEVKDVNVSSSMPLPKIASVVSLFAIQMEKEKKAQAPEKPFISIRPLSELMPKEPTKEPATMLPVIQNVMSLDPDVSNPIVEMQPEANFENSMDEVMANKTAVILNTMIKKEKAIHVYKCASRFCSYTTDSAEDSLTHASAHKNLNHTDAMICAYCKFDTKGNVIDLVSHVFNEHGLSAYACNLCFYRAVASQLVAVHILKKHKCYRPKFILRSSFTTSPDQAKDSERLPRQNAVPSYNCNSKDGQLNCTFHTYTAGKFFEHLTIQHSSDSVHGCYLCKAAFTSPSDLIQHMNSHGLKLYQCSWCVFGADSEKNLLHHASQHHPNKQPEAYIRIFTNKGFLKVLPLAQFNKSTVPYPIEEIKSSVKEDPLQEVEKAVKLETLMKDNNMIVASTSAETEHVIIDLNEMDPKQSEVQVTEIVNLIEDEDKAQRHGYQCPKCKEDNYRTRFKLHVMECYRRGTVFPCAYCSFEGSFEKLIDHLRNSPKIHFNRKELYSSASKCYICAICTQREPKRLHMSHHFEQCHGLKNNVNYQAIEIYNGKTFFTCVPDSEIVNLEDVRTTTTTFYQYACGYCKYVNHTLKRIKDHVKKDHSIDKFVTLSRKSADSKIQYIVMGKTCKGKEGDEEPPIKRIRLDDKVTQIDLSDDKQELKIVEFQDYTKFVDAKNRYKCGAVGCTFIGKYLDSFRIHWGEKHLNSSFSCSHCPWKQDQENFHLRRVLEHLEMHSTTLYSCNKCHSYHYRMCVLKIHIEKNHPNEGIGIRTIREGVTSDWQCGLCKFKTAVVNVIIQHCKLLHNVSKQYRCGYCLFSDVEYDQVKAHLEAHMGVEENIFYMYYKIGTISDEIDGSPRWAIQQERTGEMESMAAVDSIIPGDSSVASKNVNKEMSNLSLEELCRKYGEFTNPDASKFKCPMCKYLMETKQSEPDEKEFVSHLYEELNYRRWGCTMCHYKAFHKEGLDDHMITEHRQIRLHYLLPIDKDIETWVAKLVQHQSLVIRKKREKNESLDNAVNVEELKAYFGGFGLPMDNNYCCPKCEEISNNKNCMIAHLITESAKIRWRCSNCPETFQFYHQVDFHLRTVHPGLGAWASEVPGAKKYYNMWAVAVVEEQATVIKKKWAYKVMLETRSVVEN